MARDAYIRWFFGSAMIFGGGLCLMVTSQSLSRLNVSLHALVLLAAAVFGVVGIVLGARLIAGDLHKLRWTIAYWIVQVPAFSMYGFAYSVFSGGQVTLMLRMDELSMQFASAMGASFKISVDAANQLQFLGVNCLAVGGALYLSGLRRRSLISSQTE